MPGCPQPLRLFRAPRKPSRGLPSLCQEGDAACCFPSQPPGGQWTKAGMGGDCLPTACNLQGLRSLWNMPLMEVWTPPPHPPHPRKHEKCPWRPKKLDKIAQWGEELAIIIPCCIKKTTGGNCQQCYILLSSEWLLGVLNFRDWLEQVVNKILYNTSQIKGLHVKLRRCLRSLGSGQSYCLLNGKTASHMKDTAGLWLFPLFQCLAQYLKHNTHQQCVE